MGSLYKRGNVWWAKYYRNGRPVRESTGKTKEKEAETFLKQREGAVAEGRPVPPRVDKIRYEEARGDLVLFYETTGRRKLVEVRGRLVHLDAFFRGARLADITSEAPPQTDEACRRVEVEERG